MRRLYTIQYDIKTEDKIVERIKSLGPWMKYFPNGMIVATTLSPKEIYERISIDYPTSRILIFEVNKTGFYGRLPTEAWDWLKKV